MSSDNSKDKAAPSPDTPDPFVAATAELGRAALELRSRHDIQTNLLLDLDGERDNPGGPRVGWSHALSLCVGDAKLLVGLGPVAEALGLAKVDLLVAVAAANFSATRRLVRSMRELAGRMDDELERASQAANDADVENLLAAERGTV